MAIIIFLNGTSSSGKSSIAKEIQKQSPRPYLHMMLDTFLKMLSLRQHSKKDTLDGIVQGFHGSINAMANTGNDIVVDHVLQDPEWLKNVLVSLKSNDAIFFIGLHCDLEIIEQRETARGDRKPGTAAYQFDRVHANTVYDLELDTGNNDPKTCARMILDHIEKHPEPLGWKRTMELNGVPLS